MNKIINSSYSISLYFDFENNVDLLTLENLKEHLETDTTILDVRFFTNKSIVVDLNSKNMYGIDELEQRSDAIQYHILKIVNNV